MHKVLQNIKPNVLRQCLKRFKTLVLLVSQKAITPSKTEAFVQFSVDSSVLLLLLLLIAYSTCVCVYFVNYTRPIRTVWCLILPYPKIATKHKYSICSLKNVVCFLLIECERTLPHKSLRGPKTLKKNTEIYCHHCVVSVRKSKSRSKWKQKELLGV